MKTLTVLTVLLSLLTGQAHAAFFHFQKHVPNPNELSQIQSYADSAILNAAEHGYRRVVLHLPNAAPAAIDQLTEELRARGYAIDEEEVVLNPEILVVRFLKGAK